VLEQSAEISRHERVTSADGVDDIDGESGTLDDLIAPVDGSSAQRKAEHVRHELNALTAKCVQARPSTRRDRVPSLSTSGHLLPEVSTILTTELSHARVQLDMSWTFQFESLR